MENKVPSNTNEFYAWQNMIQRCTNPNLRQYADYGGRGIKVFPLWLGRGGFKHFLAVVGKRPTPNHTLDRCNNDVGYEPGNVRWATRTEQNRNTSKNVFLTANGQTKTVSEWAEITGIKHSTLFMRIRLGWSHRDIVLAPVRPKRRH